MENQYSKLNIQELLSHKIGNECSKFLEILENFDNSIPSRETALIVKKAMTIQKNPIMAFLLKKSFRLAAFKLKGASFKISLAGLEKLLNSRDRLDDLALAITSVNKTEAFLASDCFKAANWKEFPAEILPCFCTFFKNNGNSQDLDDLLELTRNPNPIVIAAAVEAIKKLDTGSLRSIIAPLLKNNSEKKESEAIEQLYASNINYDSSNISNASKEYYLENHSLLIDTLKKGTSDLETVRILRLIKKYGNENDSEYVKPFLTKENPEILRAAIKVLEKLAPDYLCVYLPQLMQHKNNKIRLTATRAFQSIDKESVISLVKGSLKSLNVKQRSIGITTSMIVDFFKIKEDLIAAFGKETNEELLEKVGLVLAANPYRELIIDIYKEHKDSKTLLKNQREKIIELCSEKVSLAFGGTPWAKELIFEAQQKYEQSKNNKETNLQESETTKSSPRFTNKSTLKSKSKDVGNLHEKIQDQLQKQESESFLEKIGWYAYSAKSKLIILFFLLGSVLSSVVIVLLIMKLF